MFLCSVEIKISPTPENHTSQSTADPLGSLFKGASTSAAFAVVSGTSDLGHARWMPFVYTRVYIMLYWTGKKECKLQYAFLTSPTQTYRVFLISPFPKATTQDPLHHNSSFLKDCSYFACLNYSQGYKHCPLTEVVLRGLVPK